jgi:hypothetical protein
MFPLFVHAQTPQEDWIEKLHQCENKHNVEKIWDTNNQYSYGAYMFQLDTFWGFGKQYGFFPKELTREEARLLIHVESIQKAIATAMLEDGLDYHWKNCRDKKIGYRYPISSRET